MEEIKLWLEVVHQLDGILSPKLTECTMKEKQAVRLFASLILSILHLLKQMCQEETDEASIRIKECKEKLQKFVKDWVVKHKVIGGSLFGGQMSYREKLPRDTNKELKVIFMKVTTMC